MGCYFTGDKFKLSNDTENHSGLIDVYTINQLDNTTNC